MICHNHVSFQDRLSPAKQSDTAGKVIFFLLLFALVHHDPRAKIILEILLKKKRKGGEKGKKASESRGESTQHLCSAPRPPAE